MAGSVRLVLTFHNHQPVGNFDGVFEQAYRDSYRPFLDVMQDYPDIPFGLHNSGSLLEWLEVRHPEYIERLRKMAASSQVEIIGGAYYEPILANIPRRDRIGQIQSYTRHLNELFHTNVRGMWLPERVWEQSFASDIAAAGIQYTIIDDYHFRCFSPERTTRTMTRHHCVRDVAVFQEHGAIGAVAAVGIVTRGVGDSGDIGTGGTVDSRDEGGTGGIHAFGDGGGVLARNGRHVDFRANEARNGITQQAGNDFCQRKAGAGKCAQAKATCGGTGETG